MSILSIAYSNVGIFAKMRYDEIRRQSKIKTMMELLPHLNSVNKTGPMGASAGGPSDSASQQAEVCCQQGAEDSHDP